MNRFTYRIHYDADARRIGHIAMDSDAVFAALCAFRNALPQYMAELHATVKLPESLHRHRNAIRLVVGARLDWEKASIAMKGFADRHGLRATHVTSALLPERPVPVVWRPGIIALCTR